MPPSTHVSNTVDEVVAEIASILAEGYLRHRKSREISSTSENERKKVKHSQVFTENRLDRSGHRSVHE